MPSSLQSGLIAYFPFCGDANDESVNTHDGTVNGASLDADRFGNPSSAYRFDGIDDKIDLPDLGVHDNFSISVFINADSFDFPNKDAMAILGENISWDGSDLHMHFGPDNLWAPVHGSPSFPYTPISINDSLNQWIHVVYSYEKNGDAKFYINGVLGNTQPGNSSVSLDGISVGTNHTDVRHFDGAIDDLSFYNRALTASEVSQLYSLGDYNITWSTGDTTSAITVTPTATTNYSVLLTNGVDSITDYYTIYTLNCDTCIDTNYVNIYDTTVVFDTIRVVEQVWETIYDTITHHKIVYDTIPVYDTIYVTVTDTLWVEGMVTGDEDIYAKENTIRIYPNPSSNTIYLDADIYNYTLAVYGIDGRLVFREEIYTPQYSINVRELGAKGTYLFKILDPQNNLVDTKHIIIN